MKEVYLTLFLIYVVAIVYAHIEIAISSKDKFSFKDYKKWRY